MAKFKLAIALHNHQPVGNFDFVFEDAHNKAYAPLLDVFSKFPQIKFSLHQSGILWEWQKKNYPQYFDLVKRMISDNQVELLTGGFFEPIFISIPEKDIIGQVKMLNEFLIDNFDFNPEGGWLTERIWEPHLPKILNQSGIKYLAVDDTHFIYAGFDYSQLNKPFITEHENFPITLFPISQKLRYLIPFGKVDEIINELKKMAESSPNGLAVYADDGEKFGLWPNTYEHCYQDGWLEDFCDAITKNSDWLDIISIGEASKIKPVGRAYLPSASYSEMLHWSLPSKPFSEYEKFLKLLSDLKVDEKYNKFIHGAHWRGFLTKYEEANLMHKKMMHLSDKLSQVKENYENDSIYLDAVKNLYAAQCNCPYWHGVFGGLYLPHIRKAIYSHLIKGEILSEKLVSESETISVIDYDLDGNDEVIIKNDKISSIFKPSYGGIMVELFSKEPPLNLTDTLSRYKEGYHYKLYNIEESDNKAKSIHEQIVSKEEGLDKLLIEDWYLKRCFIDHIFAENTDLNKFKINQYSEIGDFILENYDYEFYRAGNYVQFTREGNIRKGHKSIPCKITKKFVFTKNTSEIQIEYQLENINNESKDILFGIENNFNLQAGHTKDRYIKIDNTRHENSFLDSEGKFENAKSYMLVDDFQKISISLNSELNCQLWHYPIFTVSLSEGGFEKVYQGTTFVNLFKLNLSEEPVKLNFTLSIITGN